MIWILNKIEVKLFKWGLIDSIHRDYVRFLTKKGRLVISKKKVWFIFHDMNNVKKFLGYYYELQK